MADIKFRSFGPVPVHVVPIQSFSQYFHYYFSRIMILFFQYKRRKRPWTISLRQFGYWRSKIKLRYELSNLFEWSNVTIFHKMDHLKWFKHTCRSSLLWMKIWSDILLLRLTKGKNMIDQSHNKIPSIIRKHFAEVRTVKYMSEHQPRSTKTWNPGSQIGIPILQP